MLVLGSAPRAHELVGGALAVWTIYQDAEHEWDRMNAPVESIVDQIVQARVLATGLAGETLLVHDVSSEVNFRYLGKEY